MIRHVGRSPWTAADALVGLSFSRVGQGRTRGPAAANAGADAGIRTTPDLSHEPLGQETRMRT